MYSWIYWQTKQDASKTLEFLGMISWNYSPYDINVQLTIKTMGALHSYRVRTGTPSWDERLCITLAGLIPIGPLKLNTPCYSTNICDWCWFLTRTKQLLSGNLDVDIAWLINWKFTLNILFLQTIVWILKQASWPLCTIKTHEWNFRLANCQFTNFLACHWCDRQWLRQRLCADVRSVLILICSLVT